MRRGRAVPGIADYRLDGSDAAVFTHTALDPQQTGKGYSSQLANGAFDDVRNGKWKAVARCEFIARFIDRHPTYPDLLKQEE